MRVSGPKNIDVMYLLCYIYTISISFQTGDLVDSSPQSEHQPKVDESESSVMGAFLRNVERSQKKYPNNRQMFDGLLGEIHELKRAYEGDGDVRSEALDVAVCAFRIAQEGDSGGNEKLSHVPDWLAWGSSAPAVKQETVAVVTNTGIHRTLEGVNLAIGTKLCADAPGNRPMVATAWYVERKSPGKRDHGMRLGPFWKREEAEGWVDDRHVLRALVSVAPKSVSDENSFAPSGDRVLAGWVQYINGVQTQKLARNEAELESLKWNEALSEKAEYFPVYF